jgi:septal ring factor EnvC (AmiA/AmiB activator)
MERSAGPPSHPPAPSADDDALAATRGDLRGLRRWLAVAGVWALAATAIAVIALIKASDERPSGDRADTARQIAEAERALDHRIDSLRSQIQTLPSSQDLSRVEQRLRRAEDDAKKASNDVQTASAKLDDLSKRVDGLAKSQAGAAPGQNGNPAGK